jgi:hypothetical protein
MPREDRPFSPAGQLQQPDEEEDVELDEEIEEEEDEEDVIKYGNLDSGGNLISNNSVNLNSFMTSIIITTTVIIIIQYCVMK